jgi:putative flippase GtrA
VPRKRTSALRICLLKITSHAFFRFLLVGSAAFVADVVYTKVLLLFAVPIVPLRVSSFLTFSALVWYANRTYSFKVNTPPTFREYFKFMASVSVGGAVNIAVSSYVLHSYTTLPFFTTLAVAAGVASGMVFNFIAMRYVVWGKREN